MTARDEARRATGSMRRDAHADAARRMSVRSLPERLVRRSRAQGRRPLPRRARHEDPGPLPRGARARRVRRAAGRRVHEGLPAQLRAVPRPRSGGGAPPVAPRARRHGVTPSRASPSRGRSRRRAQGLTFSPVVVVAALLTRADRAVRRSTSASSSCASPSRPTLAVTRRRPRSSRSTRTPRRTCCAGTSTPGATVTIAEAAPRAAEPRVRRRDGPLDRRAWTSAAARTSSRSARSTRRPASTPRTPGQVVITVPFLVIEAPTLTVDQPADGATFENGAIPVKGIDDERDDGRRSSAVVHRPRRAPARSGAPPARQGATRCGPDRPITVDDGRLVRARRSS